jgi:hypothetical protein
MPWAGIVAVASTQRGSYSTTEPTGSPMAEAGIERPAFSISALVTTILPGPAWPNAVPLINKIKNTLSIVVSLMIRVVLTPQDTNVVDICKDYFIARFGTSMLKIKLIILF